MAPVTVRRMTPTAACTEPCYGSRMSLLGILVLVLVAALICWALTLVPAPPRIIQILQLLVIVIVVIYVVSAVFGGGPVIRVD